MRATFTLRCRRLCAHDIAAISARMTMLILTKRSLRSPLPMPLAGLYALAPSSARRRIARTAMPPSQLSHLLEVGCCRCGARALYRSLLPRFRRSFARSPRLSLKMPPMQKPARYRRFEPPVRSLGVDDYFSHVVMRYFASNDIAFKSFMQLTAHAATIGVRPLSI